MRIHKTYVLLIVASVMVLIALNIAYASSGYTIIYWNSYGTLTVPPGTPICNIWNPKALWSFINAWESLAYYNTYNGQWWPVLASNWTLFPQNDTIIIHLRRGLVWFNGSATMPFTAWDVYAEFYIGVKAFDWWYPYVNADGIRVINNYTLSIQLTAWSPTTILFMLTEPITTPWPYWEPVVKALKTMNSTYALTVYGPNNVTTWNPPCWSLAPYYFVAFYPGTATFVTQLEPPNILRQWYNIFPYEDWQYYPVIDYVQVLGNTQALTGLLSGKATWSSVALSLAQIGVVNKSGLLAYMVEEFGELGMAINPLGGYPFNTTQFRKALCYAVNLTAAIAVWGIGTYYPSYYPAPVFPTTIDTYPPSVKQFIIPCSYNTTKAAELLESIGMYKKGNQWYLPNGTPLTLTVITPSGFTDWATITEGWATQLSLFGIPTKVLALDTGTYWSSIFPSAQFEVANTLSSYGRGYYDPTGLAFQGPLEWIPWVTELGIYTWPFQWPNGTCTPVVIHLPPSANSSLVPANGTVVWCINSTLGYINLTNWFTLYDAATPGTHQYNELLKVLFAWYDYYVPIVPVGWKRAEVNIGPKNYLITWAYNVPNPMCEKYIPPWLRIELMPSDNSYIIGAEAYYYQVISSPVWEAFWGSGAPAGAVPPLIEAMVNGSLWIKHPDYAEFLGLTPSYLTDLNQLRYCLAQYFNITSEYVPSIITTSTTTTTTTTTTSTTTTSTTTTTPVTTSATTSTTTSTVTTTAVSTVVSTVTTTAVSTVTSTATTTAVSTVTVTKPVVSTALIAGIVIIVIVIAAVAAIIALRRR
ncbi:ABC transporter substrate-binding protein [Caldivirga maquilingensis]|uniref:Extracellular solute-binding protein family 5 n=1 Tax=Caldivirga maquilingensis (strain ATCC 700844 / DSM 13496 / JCM 10307 / IC-167) TaxID=397948 RepID=A8MCI8_CALMQ|nr:ABC transporter substrate-binding protein [Caldivirga maquilingensis]ABW01494.1 extracellular solute-binding protein family 5 [Caldivirga maquilingensis IC-167]